MVLEILERNSITQKCTLANTIYMNSCLIKISDNQKAKLNVENKNSTKKTKKKMKKLNYN